MKKILFPFFVLLSSISFGQANIILDTVGNACHIDKIGFAKDNMTYTLNGDSSINIVIVGATSYQNAHYSRFRDPLGAPFANRTALTNWLDLYFFANASADTTSGGGGLALGETSTTAYRGDRGKVAYDHSQITDGTNPHATTFANINSKPTTRAGYGITDAYPLSGNPSNFLTAVPAQTFASLTGKPTTISGYGITDAITQGGNSYNADITIGTNDNFLLGFRVNNFTVAKVNSSGIFTGVGISNLTTANNSRVLTQTTGVMIDRNVADATTLVKFNHINASSTGAIAEFQKAGVTIASISNAGAITGTKLNVSALNTSPASATDTGTTGEIRITSGFIYVCIAPNVWVRTLLTTF